MYETSKEFNHDLGLTAIYRLWRSQTKQHRLRGASLAFEMVFGVGSLDEQDWLIEIGGLAPVEDFLVLNFDHTVLVAKDDPQREVFCELDRCGLARLRVIEGCGVEAVARYVYDWVSNWLHALHPGVTLLRVTCCEQGGRRATYEPDRAGPRLRRALQTLPARPSSSRRPAPAAARAAARSGKDAA
jgi:6-pyruvoyltetrahydropterin/6-carboxytetrahydropterin synthase